MTIHPTFLNSVEKGRCQTRMRWKPFWTTGSRITPSALGDFYTYLMLYGRGEKSHDGQGIGKTSRQSLHRRRFRHSLVSREKNRDSQLVPSSDKRAIEETMVSLYQDIWGMDLGCPPSGRRKKAREAVIRRLTRIPYLDRTRWPEEHAEVCTFHQTPPSGATGGRKGRNREGQEQSPGEHDLESLFP